MFSVHQGNTHVHQFHVFSATTFLVTFYLVCLSSFPSYPRLFTPPERIFVSKGINIPPHCTLLMHCLPTEESSFAFILQIFLLVCLLGNVFPQSPVEGRESSLLPEGNEILDIQPKPSSPDRTNPSSPKSHITSDIGKKRKKASEAGRGQSSSHAEPQGKRPKGVVVKPPKTSHDDGDLPGSNGAGAQSNQQQSNQYEKTTSRLEAYAKWRQEQSGLTMEQKGVGDHIARNQKRISCAVQVIKQHVCMWFKVSLLISFRPSLCLFVQCC